MKYLILIISLLIIGCAPMLAIHGQDGVKYYADNTLAKSVNCYEKYSDSGASRGCCCDGQISRDVLLAIHRCNY